MAFRSLFLSFALTAFFGYSLTVGLTDPHSFLKRLPDWTAIPMLIAGAVGYLLATWWACLGFREHKITALASLGFCALGLGVYATGFLMEFGQGKAAPGQYDYSFARLNESEKTALTQIANETGSKLEDAVFTEHWHAAEPSKGFRICVQKGRITALNFSDHEVKNLAPFSQLQLLSDLYLRNCGLADLSALQSGTVDRLDVSDNQITDLKTLRGCPNLRWLFAKNNRLKSTEGIDQFRQIVSQDFSGNPLP